MSAPLSFPQAAMLLDAKSAARMAEAFVTIQQLSAEAAAILIERLDRFDGNPDLEDDDPSGQCDEDGVNTDFMRAIGGGPGCELSDPGGCEHDGREPERGV